MASEKPIIICTRGSQLALAQANQIAHRCRAAFPGLTFSLKIVKTTGDKLQKASLAQWGDAATTLPKGLFTKELETALLMRRADMAVHSLKDLPTDLPPGLLLAATPKREDARDVLIYRAGTGKAKLSFKLRNISKGATIGTSSPRRRLSLLAERPDLKIVPFRGNVTTRLQKVAAAGGPDATVLALAGLTRLEFKIAPSGVISGDGVPSGLLAVVLDLEEMLPCVGQGAIGLEIRELDERAAKICARLNHADTFHAITAERAFLRGMGGGCQSPVGAYAHVSRGKIWLTAVSFHNETVKRARAKGGTAAAAAVGTQVAKQLK